MKPPLSDLEPPEREDMTAAAPALEALRANRQQCPSIQVLRAAALEALPDDTLAAVRAHLERCAGCRRLGVDLAELPVPAHVAPAEDRRIRTAAGLDHVSRDESARWPFLGRRWLPVLAYSIAGLAVVAVGATLWLSSESGPTPTVRVPQAPSAERQPAHARRSTPGADPDASNTLALPLAKPEVRLTLTAMTWRGGGSAHPFVDQVGPALDAFRTDHYANAVQRFEALQRKFPDSVEVPFYLGVSRLFLGRNAEAVPALQTALQLADDTFRDDSRWYLALALDRSGRPSQAREQFSILCRTSNAHTTLACAAAASLDKR